MMQASEQWLRRPLRMQGAEEAEEPDGFATIPGTERIPQLRFDPCLSGHGRNRDRSEQAQLRCRDAAPVE